ncbi:hypothetical protein MIMGU_mgv1a0060082mg, partial [Erythranthe guttata]
MSVTAAQ